MSASRGRQLVGAVGDQQQHPGVSEVAHQERQQLPGRGIGPVDVLEHHHQRPHRSAVLEQPGHSVEQPPPTHLRLATGRSQLGQSTSQAGLAQPGIAPQQHTPRCPGPHPPQLGPQRLNLPLPPHQRPIHPLSRHRPHAVRRRRTVRGIEAHLPRRNRVRDVLHRQPAKIVELVLDPSDNLPVDIIRDTDPAGMGPPLKAGGDVHDIADDIAIVLNDELTHVDTDAQQHPLQHGQIAIARASSAAGPRPPRVLPPRPKPPPPAARRQCPSRSAPTSRPYRVNSRSMVLPGRQRAVLVLRHHRRVPDDVDNSDGGQSSRPHVQPSRHC